MSLPLGIDRDERRAAGSFEGFALPRNLEAWAPREVQGGERDGVRLQVASASSGITDSVFNRLADHLRPGDLLVVNDSATLPAAVEGQVDGRAVRVHISTRIPGTALRLVELREPLGPTSRPMQVREATRVGLRGGGDVELIAPHDATHEESRLWKAAIRLPEPLVPFLYRHGQPIRYGYPGAAWPLHHYQTMFAMRPGSSEMPSAGRPFTRRLVDQLLGRGAQFESITLHTGLASCEAHELPYAEEFCVPARTAAAVNRCRAAGGRVIAVGTTVVRTLESARCAHGQVEPCTGFTDLVVTPDRDIQAIDGLITGWHEPNASHLMMLEAIAGSDLLSRSYKHAISSGYLWHEFGDIQLIFR